MKYRALLLALFLITAVYAIEDISQRFVTVMCDLYNLFKSLLPIVLILAIAFAAVIMVAGQLLGAETRAKASSWAQNIVIYALVAVIVIVLVPYVIQLIAPELNFAESCPNAGSIIGGGE